MRQTPVSDNQTRGPKYVVPLSQIGSVRYPMLRNPKPQTQAGNLSIRHLPKFHKARLIPLNNNMTTIFTVTNYQN